MTRGDFGTTAASYSSGASLSVSLVPSGVQNACLAEALDQVQQETAGYARTAGTQSAALLKRTVASGGRGNQSPQQNAVDAIDAKWDRVVTTYGRTARTRVV